MKNRTSLIAVLVILIVLLVTRIIYSGIGIREHLKVTEWDAFGYNLYLPSSIIYKDCTRLEWVAGIDKKYAVTGGNGLPATKLENGSYVFKYLGGVAIMQTPFFLLGHALANSSGYPADGYSSPYQYALGFGALLYAFLALLILRRVLLRFFGDRVVAAALPVICLGSNYIVYAAIDNGLSHSYIFMLYALVLYTTMRWHQRPHAGWAAATGYLIGLSTISRPTEAIMLFIPLLWNTHNRAAAKQKWAAVGRHKSHLAIILIAGFIGILPQLLYWKAVTGSFVYDVGSKWQFLNPHWRVLLGPEKGWLLYTPVAAFFIAGLFFIRRFPFRYSALIFLLLNIWIVIAWDDWRYGGSYSTRALVQSYPVFALPLCALIDRIKKRQWQILFSGAALYLVFVNIFQTGQYASGVLHFNDMNPKYYRHIYLNPSPSPEVMSLLDTDVFLENENNFPNRDTIYKETASIRVSATRDAQAILWQDSGLILMPPAAGDYWLKTEAVITGQDDLWSSRLNVAFSGAGSRLQSIRLFNPVGVRKHRYAVYTHVPASATRSTLRIWLSTAAEFNGVIEKLVVTRFRR